jgi:hypothetical protein
VPFKRLTPSEARLAAQPGEKLLVDREFDEANPWLELILRPTHQRDTGDQFVDGYLHRRSSVITYHPRDLSLVPL